MGPINNIDSFCVPWNIILRHKLEFMLENKTFTFLFFLNDLKIFISKVAIVATRIKKEDSS